MGRPDLDAWEKFATELVGLQVAERTPDRLRLRNDRNWYRLLVERGEAEGVTTLGWEVDGPAELVELAKILESAGYDVTEESDEFCTDRGAMGIVSFTDPDGMRVELGPYPTVAEAWEAVKTVIYAVAPDLVDEMHEYELLLPRSSRFRVIERARLRTAKANNDTYYLKDLELIE